MITEEKQAESPKPPVTINKPIILGDLTLASPQLTTTIGSTGSAASLPALPTGYIQLNLGNVAYVVPYYAVGTGTSTASQIKAGNQTTLVAKGGGTIFDHYADVGNGTTVETDLYSDSLAGSILNTNGDKICAFYGGIFVPHATATRQLKVYFGGTAIFDSGALAIAVGTDSWAVYVEAIRDTSSTVRCTVTMSTTGATTNAYCTYVRVTGLTLTSAQILKITGTAAGVGAASNDILSKLGYVEWKSAA